MKKKDRKPTSAGRKTLQQKLAENKATNVINAKLQKAVGAVVWGKVKLPRLLG